MWPEVRLALEQIRHARERQLAQPAHRSGTAFATATYPVLPLGEPAPPDQTGPVGTDDWAAWFTLAPVGLVTLDAELRVVRANPAASALLAVPHGTLDGACLLSHVCADSKDALRRHCRSLHQALEQHTLSGDAQYDLPSATCEVTLNATADAPRSVHVFTRMLRLEPSARWLSALIDVTADRREHGETPTQLRDLEARVMQHSLELTRSKSDLARCRRQCTELMYTSDAVQHASTDAIISVGLDGRVQAFNAASERMFGYSRAESTEISIDDLLAHGEWQRALAQGMPDTNEDRHDGVSELRARHRSGRTFPVDASIRLVGDFGLYVCVLRDISDRRALQHQVLEVAENEKRAIGQELHDSVGQQLTGLRFYAEMLAQALESKALPEAEQAVKLRDILANVADEVRQLSHGLMPSIVSAERLPDALSHLAANLDDLSHMSCRFTCHGESSLALNTSTATQLFRIAQEAAQNAIRHSQGDLIAIEFGSADDELCLEIVDNGIGIPEEALKQDNSGIRTMEYRAALIGAWLTIGSATPRGTRVECKLKTN